MNDKHAELRRSIQEAVEKFERETKCMVVELTINRLGSTQGYHIFGIYAPVVPLNE